MSLLCHARYRVFVPNDPDVSPVLGTSNVSIVREGRYILDSVSLSIDPTDRWVILGANGCGKTTLLRVLSLYLHPSSGDIFVQGLALGTFDIRPIRPRIAYMSASLASEIRPVLTATQVVMSAKNGALETWWHTYSDDDVRRAVECLDRLGVAWCADRELGALSSGEQQRVLLARALMTDPIALLLDEPTARLDLGGRENLIQLLQTFARDNPQLPSVVVTHHVDEIPLSTTHCALMKNGKIIASGPIRQTLTSESLSECFDTPLLLEQRANGRLTAYAP
jgi:iron complex transport system ATP-binding protein